ncbi:MAG: hypothetical protein CMJ62_09125 [Planctomycetaceae bacterium]|nr:hypothetical protein [Planctomycetaceae bacterium]
MKQSVCSRVLQRHLVGTDFTTTTQERKHPRTFPTPTEAGTQDLAKIFVSGTTLINKQKGECHQNGANSSKIVSQLRLSQKMLLPKQKSPSQKIKTNLAQIGFQESAKSVGRHRTKIAGVNDLI